MIWDVIWDVIVAGAGPAGAVAASVLSRAGWRVLLVDDVLPDKRKVGESLPGAARPLLQDLGLLSLVVEGPHLPSYGNLSAWGTDELMMTDFIRDPNGPGWHLDRAQFDSDLRQQAQRSGAVFQAERVRAVKAIQEGWCVHLSNGECTARWLIDATGRRAALAHSLGIRRQRDDSLVALWTWAITSDQDLDTRALVESTTNGWWYTARLPDQYRIVVLHVDREDAIAILNQPETWFERLSQTIHVKHTLAGAIFQEKPTGTEACGGRLEHFAGPGWIAVGDAALSFDPLSSQGILNALYTGMRAGQALCRALNGDGDSITAYTSQLENIRQAYLQHHRTYYQMEQRWSNFPFWAGRQLRINCETTYCKERS
jgi:flavin-dependent dehydrogenase